MTAPNMLAERGLAALKFTQEEARHPIFKKVAAALREELALMKDQLAHPSNIEHTTLLRGEIRHATRISARLSEVGPESRQSERIAPESAVPALAAERFPVSFET